MKFFETPLPLRPYVNFNNGFALIGFAAVALVTIRDAIRIVRQLYAHFGGILTTRSRLHSYGSWAVVTGCTSGVGLEICRQLAAYGINLVLIGRRGNVLVELSKDLEHRFGIETARVSSVKFPTSYDFIVDAVKGKDVGILVIAATVAYDYPQYFQKLDSGIPHFMITVNITSGTLITHLVLKHCMIPKRKGLLVFLSSASCLRNAPQISAFAATKKYQHYFASSINAELSQAGILAQSLLPCSVDCSPGNSSGRNVSKLNIFLPRASTYAKHALWTFGRTTSTTGYWAHTLQNWLCDLLPNFLWNRMFSFAMARLRFNEEEKRSIRRASLIL